VVVKALAVPAITRLSIANKAGDTTTFAKDLRRTSLIMTGVGAALIVCLILVGQPVLSLMLEHGKFHAGDSRLLWLILVLSCGQSFTISIGVKIAMFGYFGVYGLAVAVTIFFSMTIVLMLATLYRRGLLNPTRLTFAIDNTPDSRA
jgi:putative peptidoglycan lipid II flippase